MGDVVKFRMLKDAKALAAQVVEENRDSLGQGKLRPSAINILSVGEWNDEEKRNTLLGIWQSQVEFPAIGMDFRSQNDVTRIAEHPSQLLALVLDVQNPDKMTVQLLGGHYGYKRRSEHHQVEQEFDRSFVQGLGLHRLAIYYRLYLSCIDNFVSGFGEKSMVATYASINTTNERSMRNFEACGAKKFSSLPKCLRYDGDLSCDLTVPGIDFAIFSPSDALAGFYEFKKVLQYGYPIDGELVPVRTNHGFADLRFADNITGDVDKMCARHERFLKKAYG